MGLTNLPAPMVGSLDGWTSLRKPTEQLLGSKQAGQRASEASSAGLETTTNLTNVFVFSKHRPDWCWTHEVLIQESSRFFQKTHSGRCWVEVVECSLNTEVSWLVWRNRLTIFFYNWFVFLWNKKIINSVLQPSVKAKCWQFDHTVPRVSSSGDIARMGVEVLFNPHGKEVKFREWMRTLHKKLSPGSEAEDQMDALQGTEVESQTTSPAWSLRWSPGIFSHSWKGQLQPEAIMLGAPPPLTQES